MTRVSPLASRCITVDKKSSDDVADEDETRGAPSLYAAGGDTGALPAGGGQLSSGSAGACFPNLARRPWRSGR